MELTGQSIIGYGRGGKTGAVLNGFNPSTGDVLPPNFYSASEIEVDKSVQLAAQSFVHSDRKGGKERALFLRSIAENLVQFGETLVERTVLETGLAATRVRNERERTCFQLRFFADMVEDGSWVDARIDRADSARIPVPKPDVRSMLRPVGPIAVFCASNFPLAFSVAGGDTVSALASGNPVIVLAHYSHPGTAEFAGTAIRDAALKHGFPEGVFSLLYDSGHHVAQALVTHPLLKGVGFTGSRAGGTALMKLASFRPEPIPFYAEMSSVNPVFILPSALKSRSDFVAEDLHVSATLGVGQFCTNPGVIITMGDSGAFVSRFTDLMAKKDSGVMLNPNIAASYRRAILERSAQPDVRLRWTAPEAPEISENTCRVGTAVFEIDGRSWLANRVLQDEVFGPATLLVHAESREELLQIARCLEGNLTATILGTADDLRDFSDLVSLLQTKVGRLIFNGSPTGVEVCEAMVHGGPYPATSDGRSTSVGGRAIFRFTRPVSFQNFPDVCLPPELQESNPMGIWRMEDGRHIQPAACTR
jgi:alpha-ketoglutaric semialdehyde dehydrogenase